MPNYCENTLKVVGTKKDITRFANRVYGKSEESASLDFNRIIPYPKKFERLDKAWQEEYEKTGEFPLWKNGFNSGGYEWCIENWGTKWNAMYVTRTANTLADGLQEIIYTFDTAWSPPIPVVAKMAEMFPTLEFELFYQEGGEGFEGSNSFADGKQIAADVHYFESENEEEYE